MQAEEIKKTGTDNGVTPEKKNVGASAGKNQGVITVAENNPGTATVKNGDDEIKISAKLKNNNRNTGATESSEPSTAETSTKKVSDTTTDTSEPASEQTASPSPSVSVTAPKKISPTEQPDKQPTQANTTETETTPNKLQTTEEIKTQPETDKTAPVQAPNTKKETAPNAPPSVGSPTTPQTTLDHTNQPPAEDATPEKNDQPDDKKNNEKNPASGSQKPTTETQPKNADTQSPSVDESPALAPQENALEAMPANTGKVLSASEQVGAASEIAKSQNQSHRKNNQPNPTDSSRQPNPAEAASASPKTVDAPQVAQDASGRPIEDKKNTTPQTAGSRMQRAIAGKSARERQKQIKALQKEKKELELVIKEFEQETGDLLKTPPFRFALSFSTPIMLAKMMLSAAIKTILEKIKNGKGKAKVAILKSAVTLLTSLKTSLTILKKSAAITEALRNWYEMVAATVVETIGLSLIILIPLLPIYLIFAVFFDLGKMPQDIKKVIKKVSDLLIKLKKAVKVEERKINSKAKLRQIKEELKILGKEGKTIQPTPLNL